MNERVRRAHQALTKKQRNVARHLASLDPDSDEHWDMIELIGETQPPGAQVWILALEDELREMEDES